MRLTYSSIGGGEAFSSYSLTADDLRDIVAGHFGYNPETVSLRGLPAFDGEIQISGFVRSTSEEPSPV